MMATASASSIQSPMNCLLCKRVEIKMDANFWCKNCKGGICEDCVTSHKKLLLLHSIIPIDDVTDADILMSKLDLDEQCKKHKKEPVTMYCTKDEEHCCTLCALSTHKACPEVVPIDEIAESYTEELMSKDNKCLQNIQIRLENVISAEKNQRETLENDVDAMLSKALNCVNKIKQHVDSLLATFKSEVQKLKSEGLLTSDMQIKMLREFEQTLESHATTMKLFPLLEPRQRLIASFDIKGDIAGQIQSIENNFNHAKDIHMKLNINESISQLQNVQSIGTITKEESPSKSKPEIAEIGNQSRTLFSMIPVPSAQVAVAIQRNLISASVRLLKKVTKGDLNLGYVNLRGAKFLKDGRLLTSDHSNKRLLMFNSDFRLINQYPVSGTPWGLCTNVDNTTVHVVCDYNEVVSYTLQGGWQETSQFTTEPNTIGLDRSSDTIITGTTTQVVLYNIDGQKLSSISKQGGYCSTICTSANGEMFYHTDDHELVGRTLQDSKEIFRYSHPSLRCASGPSCDRGGNILVAGLRSNNIHQVSPDGQNNRILLDKLSSISQPICVCCHPNRDIFVVTSYSDDTVMEIYQFSSQ